jgi:hypothetical protein
MKPRNEPNRDVVYESFGSGVDWNSEASPILRPTLEPFGERDKFELAKWVLLGVTILFALGALAYFSRPEKGNTILKPAKLYSLQLLRWSSAITSVKRQVRKVRNFSCSYCPNSKPYRYADQSKETAAQQMLDASGGSVFRKIIGPAPLE